jgi:hypothetical protein
MAACHHHCHGHCYFVQAKYPKLETHTYQDVVHATPKLDDPNSGDIFFFGELPMHLTAVIAWLCLGASAQQMAHTIGGGALLIDCSLLLLRSCCGTQPQTLPYFCSGAWVHKTSRRCS